MAGSCFRFVPSGVNGPMHFFLCHGGFQPITKFRSDERLDFFIVFYEKRKQLAFFQDQLQFFTIF